jgi:hypothetical protein
MYFLTKSKSLNKINIELGNKMIIQTDFVKFLGITVDNTLSLKEYSEIITRILNKACYIIRSSKLYLSQATLRCTMLFSTQ